MPLPSTDDSAFGIHTGNLDRMLLWPPSRASRTWRKEFPPHGGLCSGGSQAADAPHQRFKRPVPAGRPGRMDTTVTPAERMRELAADPFIRDTETRASLEFHRSAHENCDKWWALERQAYLTYPSNPSE